MVSIAGSPDASEEFESNASRWLSPAGFPAAAWIEQVPASQRAAYERRTGNPIVTIDRQLRIVPAGSRSSYLPATLVSGIPPMETPGIDLAGESGVAAAVTRASALDDVRATPLATLRDGEKGLFLIRFAPSLTGGVVRPAFVVLFMSEPSLRAAITDTAPVQLAVGGTSAGDLGGTAAARATRSPRPDSDSRSPCRWNRSRALRWSCLGSSSPPASSSEPSPARSRSTRRGEPRRRPR